MEPDPYDDSFIQQLTTPPSFARELAEFAYTTTRRQAKFAVEQSQEIIVDGATRGFSRFELELLSANLVGVIRASLVEFPEVTDVIIEKVKRRHREYIDRVELGRSGLSKRHLDILSSKPSVNRKEARDILGKSERTITGYLQEHKLETDNKNQVTTQSIIRIILGHQK